MFFLKQFLYVFFMNKKLFYLCWFVKSTPNSIIISPIILPQLSFGTLEYGSNISERLCTTYIFRIFSKTILVRHLILMDFVISSMLFISLLVALKSSKSYTHPNFIVKQTIWPNFGTRKSIRSFSGSSDKSGLFTIFFTILG